MHGGQANRRGVHAVEEGIQPVLGGLVLVALPEAQKKHRALAIGKLAQVFLASGVVIILEQQGVAVGRLIDAVTHKVTHQAYERQVDGLAYRVAQAWAPTIVFFAKVIEVMHPAASEKTFAGAGGVLPIQRCGEHLRQVLILVLHQVIEGPAG